MDYYDERAVAQADQRSAWRRDATMGVILLSVILLGAGVFFTERYNVITGSMEPTLPVGSTVWAIRTFDPPKRGDIVSFANPTSPGSGEVLIKRVVGLPGERIEAVDGNVLVNFGQLNEALWTGAPLFTENFGPIELGNDQYFVMGDNRANSIDSRAFGPISASIIDYEVRP